MAEFNNMTGRPVSAVVIPNSYTFYPSPSFNHNEVEVNTMVLKTPLNERPKSQKFARFMKDKMRQRNNGATSSTDQSQTNVSKPGSTINCTERDEHTISISSFDEDNDDPTVSIMPSVESFDSDELSTFSKTNCRKGQHGMSLHQRKTSLVKKFEERKKYHRYLSPDLFIFEKKSFTSGVGVRDVMNKDENVENKGNANNELLVKSKDDDERRIVLDGNVEKVTKEDLHIDVTISSESDIKTYHWESNSTVKEQQRIRELIETRLGSGFVNSRRTTDNCLGDKPTKASLLVYTASTESSSPTEHYEDTIGVKIATSAAKKDARDDSNRDRYDTDTREDDAVTIVSKEIKQIELTMNEQDLMTVKGKGRNLNEKKYSVAWVDEIDRQNKEHDKMNPLTKVYEYRGDDSEWQTGSQMDPPTESIDDSVFRDPPVDSERMVNSSALAGVSATDSYDSEDKHSSSNGSEDVYEHPLSKQNNYSPSLAVQNTVSTIDIDHYGIEDKYQVY